MHSTSEQPSRKIYFVSDFHLGIDASRSSREREQQIIRWLDTIREDVAELYLVGDVFDFWFEYKTVVPKGHVRLLGKLAALADGGLPIHFFTGNHDMWIFRYFEEELGIPTYRRPIVRQLLGKTFFIGHGDGLGPNDYGYKRLKKIFENQACQWLFERLHPNFGIRLADYWSGKSRRVNPAMGQWLGEDNEWLVSYCHRKLDQGISADFFIFGHRHLPIDFTLKNGYSRYINLGDWLQYNSYGVFDGERFDVRFFENPFGKIFPG